MPRTIPVKVDYAPTLGGLLSPWWQRSGQAVRVVVLAIVITVLAAAAGGVLTVLDASYSHGGHLPFHFLYKGLSRTAPDPGGYVRVVRLRHGRLADSFAVMPLHLPPYAGSETGYLPLYAVGYVQALARRSPGFALISEGKTHVNNLNGYGINYLTRVGKSALNGRDVLLLSPAAGAREGVVLVMLTRASPLITNALPVGSGGLLREPEKSFSLG